MAQALHGHRQCNRFLMVGEDAPPPLLFLFSVETMLISFLPLIVGVGMDGALQGVGVGREGALFTHPKPQAPISHGLRLPVPFPGCALPPCEENGGGRPNKTPTPLTHRPLLQGCPRSPCKTLKILLPHPHRKVLFLHNPHTLTCFNST